MIGAELRPVAVVAVGHARVGHVGHVGHDVVAVVVVAGAVRN